jgi:hypothetical protein
MIKNPAADHQLTIDKMNGEKPFFKKGIKRYPTQGRNYDNPAGCKVIFFLSSC